ncbi:hypothetical protein FDZ73_23735, partial [bacterium]
MAGWQDGSDIFSLQRHSLFRSVFCCAFYFIMGRMRELFRRNRGLSVFLAVLIMAGLVVAGCGGQKEETKPTGSTMEPIKIGMVLDSSGNASSLGMPERNSALLLEEKINAAGGINGRPVKLIIEDSESDESKAVLKAKKLVEQDKVVAIVGATTTGTTMAMVKYIESVGIPLISP